MSEAAGRDGDSHDSTRCRMTRELGSIRMKASKLVISEFTEAPKSNVQSTGCVTLGEYENVIRVHHPVMETQQSIQCGEISSYVSYTSVEVHLK